MYIFAARTGIRSTVLLLALSVGLTVGGSATAAAQPAPAADVAAETGALSATVRDAATGQPASTCVQLVPVERDRYTQVYLDEWQLGRRSSCSDEHGQILAEGVEPGRYQLFAWESLSGERQYGRQWVGLRGGTGQRHLAAVIRVRAGAVATAPQIRLDPPGAITGTVTNAATGQPVANAYVWWVPMVPHPKYTPDVAITDANGRYRIDGFGPYRWPLQFSGVAFATQWSGGTGNALLARTVQVRSGQTATLDQALRASTTVRGAILIDEVPSYAPIIAFNAVTGDVVGVDYIGETYQIAVLPGQVIKLRCDCSRFSQWHPTGQAFSDAAVVPVGRTPVTIDFDFTATSSSAADPADHPAAGPPEPAS
jgi:hypothetical protein